MTRPGEGNRRAMIFGGVGLVLVLLVAAVHFLTGGGGAPPGAAPAPPTTLAPGLPGAGGTTSTTGVPPSAQIFTSKDPFTPLAGAGSTGSGAPTGSGSAASSAPASGGATSTSTPTGSGGPSAVGSTTTTTPGSGGASGAGTAPGGSTSPTSGQEFQVMDVYASGQSTQASIQVDGLLYQVSQGQTFDGNYYVVDLSQSTQCGDFTHGGAPFHSCKGQQVLK
ncbi:MAG: hypothetical protein ACYCSJ_06805 [Acidimicrobiales bacterium]